MPVISSAAFRASDRVPDPAAWTTSYSLSNPSHTVAATAAANEGISVKPRDAPGYVSAAQFARRTHVVLGVESQSVPVSEARSSFVAPPSSSVRGASSAPRRAGLLDLGHDPISHETISRASFTAPVGGSPSKTHAERVAQILAQRVTSFQLGTEPRVNFETTSRAASKIAATMPLTALVREKTVAATRAQTASLRWAAEGEKCDFTTASRDGLPRHSAQAYVDKRASISPSDFSGPLAMKRTTAMLDATGGVVEATRVSSALDLGHDAPSYVSKHMEDVCHSSEVRLSAHVGGGGIGRGGGAWGSHTHCFVPAMPRLRFADMHGKA